MTYKSFLPKLIQDQSVGAFFYESNISHKSVKNIVRKYSTVYGVKLRDDRFIHSKFNA